MGYIAAVAIMAGVLSLLNLALTLAVIRRMRREAEQAALVARRGPALRVPPGTRAPEFAATTLSGASIGLGDLTGARSVIGFFSPNCAPCHTQLPEFIELARGIPGGPAQVLAVLTGGADEVAEFAQALAGVASVVVEPRRGPVAQAFSAVAYPTFYALDERGVVTTGGAAVRMVAAPEPV
jgi:peroxiredoxin